MTTLADNIRRFRHAAGLTQEQAAHQLGVVMVTWHKWETDNALPDLRRIESIGELLGVTVAELVTPQEEPEEQATAQTPAKEG